jgi:hypothetical protein
VAERKDEKNGPGKHIVSSLRQGLMIYLDRQIVLSYEWERECDKEGTSILVMAGQMERGGQCVRVIRSVARIGNPRIFRARTLMPGKKKKKFTSVPAA